MRLIFALCYWLIFKTIIYWKWTSTGRQEVEEHKRYSFDLLKLIFMLHLKLVQHKLFVFGVFFFPHPNSKHKYKASYIRWMLVKRVFVKETGHRYQCVFSYYQMHLLSKYTRKLLKSFCFCECIDMEYGTGFHFCAVWIFNFSISFARISHDVYSFVSGFDSMKLK